MGIGVAATWLLETGVLSKLPYEERYQSLIFSKRCLREFACPP